MYGFCTPFDDIHRCLRCMYAISLCLYTILRCPPPKCVNFRTAYEKVVDRSIFYSSLLTFPKFHLLSCSSVAPPVSSSSMGSAVEIVSPTWMWYNNRHVKCSWGLGSCMQLAEHWRITTVKLGLMAKEKGKQKRVAAKKQLYERETPDFFFAEGLEMKRQSKKKSRKEADIKTKFTISYFGHACPKYEIREFCLYISLDCMVYNAQH